MVKKNSIIIAMLMTTLLAGCSSEKDIESMKKAVEDAGYTVIGNDETDDSEQPSDDKGNEQALDIESAKALLEESGYSVSKENDSETISTDDDGNYVVGDTNEESGNVESNDDNKKITVDADGNYVIEEPDDQDNATALNSIYMNMDTIWLFENIDEELTKNNSVPSGEYGYYYLDKGDSTCFFSYTDSIQSSSLYKKADYSNETYDRIRDMILATPVKPYSYESDENGKLVYHKADYILAFSYTDETNHFAWQYISAPSNMDEIIAEFNKLKDSADEAPNN